MKDTNKSAQKRFSLTSSLSFGSPLETMNPLPILSFVSLIAFSSLAQAETKTANLPEIPEVLKDLKPTLTLLKGAPVLSVTSPQPLTPAQWDAIASIHAKHFRFAENALDDAGAARLATLDPISVGINKSLLTGKGVAKFGEMKSLVDFSAMHIVKPTPEAKVAVANHPTLESFASDGAFGIEFVTAPNLRSVNLKHGAADDKFVALLANHPNLENVRLWPKGGAGITDACFVHLATLKKLKKLTVDLSVLTYAGGLNLLKTLPDLTNIDFHEVSLSEDDLAKLKADLPKVAITFTAMTPEYRTQWNAWAAKK